MPISNLEATIFSLDAYNRGYNSSVSDVGDLGDLNGLGGAGITTAALTCLGFGVGEVVANRN